MPSTLINAVANPVRNQGLVTNPANNSTKELVKLKGPGLFLSAEVTKQGGNSDLTFIILDIEGQNVVNISVAALFNQGLTSHNSWYFCVSQRCCTGNGNNRMALSFNFQ